MKKICIIFLFIFFAGCASTPVKEVAKDTKEEQLRVVESTHALYVTPKSVELVKIEDGDKKGSVFEEDLKNIFEMANKFFDLRRYEEAEKHYRNLLEKNPDHPSAAYCYYNLGLIYMRVTRWDDAETSFLQAYNAFEREQDKKDALLNYFESLKKAEKWASLLYESEKFINNNPFKLNFHEEAKQEISLRYAESLIMTGKVEEGRKLAEYWIFEITKKLPRYEAIYIPELSLAYYVFGRSFVYEFNMLKLDTTTDKLEEKCKKIIEAQTQFIKSINVGVIFWTNASAYEVAKLYMDLYAEMEGHPVPQELNDEEKKCYKCELWKKISNLLKKSRKTLVASIDAAKKINEENEYTQMSFKMIEEIDRIYESKESECKIFEEVKSVKAQ
ncbi:MAG TPA: tetratricopeptide repeat protein [bacterium]|nr:tetratricopeptide repeat protein [bacterium]